MSLCALALLLAVEAPCEEPGPGEYDGIEAAGVHISAPKGAARIEREAERTIRRLGLRVADEPKVRPGVGLLVVVVTCRLECVVRIAFLRVAYLGRFARFRPYRVILWTRLWLVSEREVVRTAREGLEAWAEEYLESGTFPEI